LTLNSAERSAPIFFSSTVAAGSLPQIIGAFKIHVNHSKKLKITIREGVEPIVLFQHHIWRKHSEVGLSCYLKYSLHAIY